LGQHWKTHFGRRAAETGSGLSVGQLRRWMDDPKPMGLPKDAQNLVILIYAAQTSQTLYLHGAPYEATLSNVPDACELRKDKLPEASDWEAALKRAGSIFGVAGLRLLSAGNVNTLSAECKKLASDKRRACQSYTQRLKQRMAELGLTPETTDRLKTASATQMLVDKLAVGELNAIVKQLASANVETSETAMGECVGKAAELEGNLDTAGWQTFELIRKLPDAHQPTAQKILTDLRSALASDEHVMELAPALRSAQAQAMRLLEKLVEVKPLTTPPPISPPPTKQEKQIVEQDSRQDLTLLAAKELLAEIDSKKKSGQSVRVNVSWVIEEGGEA
jgi:hypothetical protein